MNVIRHDAPCQQVIALAIEVLERILPRFRRFRVLQPALTVAGVEIGFDALGMEFCESFGFSSGERAVLRLAC